jgi:hypothetical protein
MAGIKAYGNKVAIVWLKAILIVAWGNALVLTHIFVPEGRREDSLAIYRWGKNGHH